MIIPSDKLIEILKSEDTVYFEDDIKTIFELYGDDWFIVDGKWELCKENIKSYK